MSINHDDQLYYYRHILPSDHMFYWLNYGQNDSRVNSQREYSRTIVSMSNPTGIVDRKSRCGTVEDFRRMLTFERADSEEPEWVAKFDIGPQFDHTGRVPQERELVFDIDMDEYDSVRTCCTGRKVCNQCFKFLVCAASVLDAVLRTDFAFKNQLWVFSGRRGIHLWICDKQAREFTDEDRDSIVRYLSFSERELLNLREKELKQPLLVKALDLISNEFVQMAQEQHWGDTIEQRRTLLGKFFSEKHAFLSNPSLMSSNNFFTQLNTLCQRNAADKSSYSKLVLFHLYPRLDVEVSRKRNHLLKAPFCIHPSTGSVCIPLTIDADFRNFKLEQVPSLAQIVRQFREKMKQDQNGTKRNPNIPPKIRMNEYLQKLQGTSLEQYSVVFDQFVHAVARQQVLDHDSNLF